MPLPEANLKKSDPTPSWISMTWHPMPYRPAVAEPGRKHLLSRAGLKQFFREMPQAVAYEAQRAFRES